MQQVKEPIGTRPRVLLDCDGVLAAFVDGWLGLINDALKTRYTAADVTDWDVCASLGHSTSDWNLLIDLVRGLP